MSLPLELVERITADAMVLRLYELGWQPIHEIIREGLFVKRTDNIFSPEMRFEYIRRVDTFFSERKPIYTWTKPQERLSNLYVYGSPIEGYSF